MASSVVQPAVPQRRSELCDDGIDAFTGAPRSPGPILDIDGTKCGRAMCARDGRRAREARTLPAKSICSRASSSSSSSRCPVHRVVGGGTLRAEFSHIAALAGARVTGLQRGVRMLKSFDAELVDWLMNRFRELGIEVRTSTTVQRVERRADGFRVLALHDGAQTAFEADLIVHAGGRAPDFEPLDLDTAGVERERGRLKLNEFLQSVSNPTVYAAGDVAQNGPPLTPVSSHDAKVAATSARNHPADYRGCPASLSRSRPSPEWDFRRMQLASRD